MQLFFGIVFFISSAYVFHDANKRKISNQLGWAAGTALLWPIVMPLYFFKRKKLTDTVVTTENRHSQPKAYALLFILSFGLYAVNFYNGWLPDCDSAKVQGVLTSILDDQSFTDTAQQSYERFSEVRHCNLSMSGRIYSYTVRWYSEDKDRFLVQMAN